MIELLRPTPKLNTISKPHQEVMECLSQPVTLDMLRQKLNKPMVVIHNRIQQMSRAGLVLNII
jgi:hypothetical protein